jgi:hypothetical protein
MYARHGKFLIGLFCLLLAVPVVAQDAPQVPEPDTQTYLFQVVVLIGGKEAADPSSDVPENARKALEDISQFLPYRSYRMVDLALIRSAGHGRGLMAGPDNHDYVVDLEFTRSRRAGKIFVEGFQLANRSRNSNPVLINTSFEVELGETIVVGSSKLNGGNEALIVLFTAIQ